MSDHRLFSLPLLALGAWMYGCAPAQQAAVATAPRPAADLPAARVDASRPTVDPRLMPPPRAPLAGMPDLVGAGFAVTDGGLKAMTADGLPPPVARALEPLKGRNFANVTEFRAAVEDRIGKPAAGAHLPSILRHALVVTLADPPEPPEGKADLQPAEAIKRPAVAAAVPPPVTGTVPGSMGSDRFRPVFFDFDRAVIKPEFKSAIAFNADVLKADRTLKVVIEGHCDERGSTEYNLALGERRAEAVRKALVAAGAAPEQLKTVSYGEERPADPGHGEAAWAKNRRAVIHFQ